VIPAEDITSPINEILFNNVTIPPMIEKGKQDAAAIINSGKGKSFNLFNEWHSSDKIKK